MVVCKFGLIQIARRALSKTIFEVQEALHSHVRVLQSSLGESKNIGVDKMEGHTVSQSRDRVLIPLASDPNFALRYTTWHGLVRVGMLLEDLDTFAVWLAYRHNYLKIPTAESNPRPMTFVTAYVDRIRIDEKYNISLGSDVVMDGYVSWVGRSSIEISMHCSQETEKRQVKFLSSKFVMVARNMDGTRSLKNIPLKITNKDEERLFKDGEAAQRWRKLSEQQSLLNVPPNEGEINTLHEFFKQTVDQREHVFRKRFLPPGHVWMRDARLDDTLLCFPIKRNVYGKIFGGFLMRKAVEVAWATAFMFSKSNCRICGMDDIVFRKSVEIGSLVLLSSQVCYSHDCFMELIVNAEVIHVDGKKELTNTFYFISQANNIVPSVIPFSYSEGILYLDGKRHFDDFRCNDDEYN